MELADALIHALEQDRARINASAPALGQAGTVELIVQVDVNRRMKQVAVRVPGMGVRFFTLDQAA